MRIRLAEPRDSEVATNVVRRSITELCRADHHDDWATLDMWLSNKTPTNIGLWIETQHVVVAIDDGNILGVAAMSKTGDARLNYVVPEARLKGVSKAMMANLEAKAIDLGLERMVLDSTTTARAFYLAAGYVSSGPSQPAFGLLISQLMHKVLSVPRSS